jgi:hypothetical protein
MKRIIWTLLFILALAIGLAGGLVYTWVFAPVEYYDTAPDSLHVQDKGVYLAMIGDLYHYEQDLARAEARLAALDVEADGAVLASHIEYYLDGGGRPEEVRNLARLAEDLGASGGVLLVFGPEPTPTPSPAPTLPVQTDTQPTVTATIPPAPVFSLVDKTAVCAEPGQPGQITIWVLDTDGNEVPGVEVVVSWATSQDRFFTGLRPERGQGYADFEMSPRTEYEVTLAGYQGDAVQELSPILSSSTCPTGTVALSWQITLEVDSAPTGF